MSKRNRPSPSESATNHVVGTRCKGNDGDTYVVTTTKSGVHRWIKDRSSGSTLVSNVLDNGGLPFQVRKKGDDVYILKVNDDGKYVDTIATYKNVNRIMKGKDPKGKEHGNTVIIHLKDKRYLFVGPTVYEFTSKEPITNYHSEIGNSAVPYPVAETNNYLYLTSGLEDVYFEKDLLSPDTDWATETWGYYYGWLFDKNDTTERAMHKVIKDSTQPIKKKMIHDQLW